MFNTREVDSLPITLARENNEASSIGEVRATARQDVRERVLSAIMWDAGQSAVYAYFNGGDVCGELIRNARALRTALGRLSEGISVAADSPKAA
jgi:hypothetical protein